MKSSLETAQFGYLHATIDIVSTILVIGCPVLLYFKQYLMIRRSGSVGSFSPFVCFVILFASVFRCLYWWAEPFELSVLLQAFALFPIQVPSTPTKILVGLTKRCGNRQKHQRRLQKPDTHHNLHNRILPELQKPVQPQKNLAMEAIPQIRPIRSHPRLNLRDSLLPSMESNSHQLHRLPFQPLRCSSCPAPTHSQLEKWLHQKFEVIQTLFSLLKKK